MKIHEGTFYLWVENKHSGIMPWRFFYNPHLPGCISISDPLCILSQLTPMGPWEKGTSDFH